MEGRLLLADDEEAVIGQVCDDETATSGEDALGIGRTESTREPLAEIELLVAVAAA